MSALGQKRTCAVQRGMSALPPKADMCGATRYVRFVPIADSCTAAKRNRYFDHLVDSGEQCLRRVFIRPLSTHGVNSMTLISCCTVYLICGPDTFTSCLMIS